jgi:hypothetical protein
MVGYLAGIIRKFSRFADWRLIWLHGLGLCCRFIIVSTVFFVVTATL